MAETDPIPPEVLQFIDATITSVDQLEILLLLRDRRARSWTAREISVELRSNEAVAAERLAAMQAMGLLQRDGDSGYQYAPADSAADRAVSLLAAVYRDYRLRIIERIYTKPDGLAAFADAFRFRKERS